MGVKRSASFNVKEGAKIVHYSDLSSGIQYLPADGIINIQSEKIRIGGFGVNATSFYKINETGVPYAIGTPLSIYLSNVGIPSSNSIGGSEGTKNWLFTIGNDFGVTVGGTLYARNGIFQGEVQAASGKIGNVIIQDGAIVSANGNFKVDSTGNLYIENKSSSDILTSIQQNTENIALKVSTSDFTGENLVSLINLSPDTVKISASHVNITGFVTFDNLATSGETTINGANVTTGLMKSANYVAGDVFSQSGSSFNLETGDIITTGFRAYGGNGSARFKGEIQAESGNIGNITIQNGAIESQNGGFKVTSSGDLSATSGKIASFSITPTGLLKEESSQYIGLGGEYAYWAGATASEAPSTAPFRVDYDGSLYATKGEIGQFTLTQYAIHSKTKQSFNDNNDGIYLGTKDDQRTLVDELANGLVDENGNELYAFESKTDFFGIGRRDGAHLFYDGNGIDISGITKIGDDKTYAEIRNEALNIVIDGTLMSSYGEKTSFYAQDSLGKNTPVVTVSKNGIDSSSIPRTYHADLDLDTYIAECFPCNIDKTVSTDIKGIGEITINSETTAEECVYDDEQEKYVGTGNPLFADKKVIINEYNLAIDSYEGFEGTDGRFRNHKTILKIDESGIDIENFSDRHDIFTSGSHSEEEGEEGETTIYNEESHSHTFLYQDLLHFSSEMTSTTDPNMGYSRTTEISTARLMFLDDGGEFTNSCYLSSDGLSFEKTDQINDNHQQIELNIESNGNAGIELCGGNAYIDFHAGYKKDEDFTQRIIASGTGNLSARPGISNVSDRREKFDITPLDEKWLEMLKYVQPVEFKYNFVPDRNYIGVIAQDIIEVMEKLGIEKEDMPIISTYPNEEGEMFYAVDYNQLMVPLFMGYKKLLKEVEELKAEKGEEAKDGD